MALGAIFASILLLSFAVFTLLAGLFTAYFGGGKSRMIGLVLTILALIAGFLFAGLTWEFLPGVTPVWEPTLVGQAVIAVVAAMLGGLASVLVFLVSIMKA